MRRLALLLLLGAAAFAPVPGPARSAPGPQARARLVLAQVNALDAQIERVAEAYDRAGVELARTRRSLRVNRRALAVTRHNLATVQARLAQLLVARYEEGEQNSTLMIVLGSTSLTDLIDRVDAAERLSAQDASLLSQVRRFQTRSLAQRTRLRRAEAAQRSLHRTLGRRRSEIEGRLAERRRLLASIQGEVARLQAKERARQAWLRRLAEARFAAQPPPSPTASAVSVTASGGGHPEVVAIALRYLGIPYQWGGASPSSGFDCSGLVLYVYAQVGISLPHNAAMQYGYGSPVARADLQPGDLVFFNALGHNGIYIGGGQFIDAPKTGDVVKIENLNDPWWSAAYVGARRLP